MTKQLSFPDIKEIDGGYTTPTESLTVKDLKDILENFPDEMGIVLSLPSKDFVGQTVSGASWVGTMMFPMSESEVLIIQSLTPSAIKRNRTFMEKNKNKKKS